MNSVVPLSGFADRRTVDQFRRAVAVLLVAERRKTPKEAVRLVGKWDVFVRRAWRAHKAPCWVADHLNRFEKDRFGNDRSRRHADHPKEGEVYEARRGDRWKVTKVVDEKGRVFVERSGHKAPGPFEWGKGSLKGMKLVEKRGQLSLFGGDPRRGSKKRGKKAKGRRVPPKRATRYVRQRKRSFVVHRCQRHTRVQAIVFDKKRWTLGRARAWLRAHGYKTGLDDKPKTMRFRQLDPRRYKVVGATEWRPGLRALFGCSR